MTEDRTARLPRESDLHIPGHDDPSPDGEIAQDGARAAKSRYAASTRRDQSAARRDESSVLRDESSRSRDRLAKGFDGEARSLDARDDLADRHTLRVDEMRGRSRSGRRRAADDRARALQDREHAEGDREHSQGDRKHAADDREHSEDDRAYAGTDDLTGARRRGVGLEELANEIKRARRESGSRLIAAFIDVDGLKAVNDLDGHAAGDALLRQVADEIRLHTRSYDLVVRLGGDEFLCALPNIALEEAQARFDVLRSDLAECGSSVSIGYAELHDGDTADDLVNRADRALLASHGG